jgi:predicted transcriptional regulator
MGAPADKDYFGSFLQGGPLQAEWPRTEASADIEQTLLRILATEGPVPLKRLIMAYSVPPSLAVSSLMQMKKSGLVDINPAADDEVSLTELGVKLAT